MRIILASASPRRKELLAKLFDRFEILPAGGGEQCAETDPKEMVKELSCCKAKEAEQAVWKTAADLTEEDYLIIGADTVVVQDGRILGKPADAAQSAEVLRMLAGNVHQVWTGVTCILRKNGVQELIQFQAYTDVKFYPMTDAEIDGYIRTGEPSDKAGSYGIQGRGGRFIESIKGDYNNVVGLPVAKLYQELKNKININI